MTSLGQVIKSPSDKRQYRAIKLTNQLDCLIIRDQDALKSSAALSMGVGSYKDPIEAQGLAHYLEHMLFMGTNKYPDENEYSNFITKNAGSNNAYTSLEQTNYMFEISSTAFEGALDRFAQFFIAPLLSESSASKEINAVDSEHQKNILNDSWRKYQLSKYLSKQGHPYNKFSTGNKETLTCENLQTMLRNFYQSNYSANLMKLVVYGQENIDTLQKWVIQKFSQIQNQNLTKFKIDSHPYDNNLFKKLLKIVPIKDLKKLELTWILPNKKKYYRNHPGSYISNLIGHQGKGSILSWLIKSGLATSLSSGNYDNSDVYTEFEVSIDLTEKGLLRIRDIIGYILHYIEMLQQNGCPEQFFKELQLINTLKFQFMDKKKGMGETSKIAKNLQERKISEVIVYPYLMEEWKPELINEYLSQLKLDNLIVFCQAKQFEAECFLTEPIYKTKYALEDLTTQSLKCDVSLPEVNIFLPKLLECLPFPPQRLPTLIYKSEFIETYFKQDHAFGLPKANINLRLMFDGSYSIIDEIGRTILLDMLKESLRQFVYLAEMAQIETQISFVSFFSLEIKFKGFRDSLKLFVVEYLNRIFQFIPTDAQLFETLVQKHRRRYTNYSLQDPYKLAYSKIGRCLRTNNSHDQQQKLIEIGNLTLEKVVRVNADWKKRLILESYFAGNITEAESKEIAQSIQNFLRAHARPHQRQQTGQLRAAFLQQNQKPIIQQILHNEKQENSAVVIHFQIGELTIKSQLLLKLTESVIKQPAFDYLRTKEQLGYVVFVLSEDNRGVGGLTFLIQSSVKSSHEIIPYVNIFVQEKMKKLIDQLTEEQFNVYKKSLQNIKEEKDKNLSSETHRYWSQIVKHKYIFERKSLQLALLPTITLQEFKNFVNDHILLNPARIELHTMASTRQQSNNLLSVKRREQEGIDIYDNIDKFARKIPLYPDFYAPN